jgi:diacylglycerol kinase
MKRLVKSFLHALRGLYFALRYEKNIQIHMVVALTIILLALFLKVTLLELTILIIIILCVFVAEFLNTIIEMVIDYISPHFSQRVRIIKDLSAGTVLMVAAGAVLIGILIFYPHLKLLIKR